MLGLELRQVNEGEGVGYLHKRQLAINRHYTHWPLGSLVGPVLGPLAKAAPQPARLRLSVSLASRDGLFRPGWNGWVACWDAPRRQNPSRRRIGTGIASLASDERAHSQIDRMGKPGM